MRGTSTQSVRHVELAVDLLHLVTLSSFAVAQPLLGLLAESAEFFVVRRSRSVDVLLLVLLLIGLVPLLMALIEMVAGLLGRGVRKLVHGFLIALLLALIFLPILKRFEQLGDAVTIGVAILLGAGGALVYSKQPAIRSFLTYLSPAVLVFPILFLFNPAVRDVVAPDTTSSGPYEVVSTKSPIVMVVFDELPVSALMGKKSRIDSKRYPNFAAFARTATWYRNATTVSDATLGALVAILTGRYPQEDRLPSHQDYPDNLFRLLAGSHNLMVTEPMSQLCPAAACLESEAALSVRMESLISDLSVIYLHLVTPTDLAQHLPPVGYKWKDFWVGPATGQFGSQKKRDLTKELDRKRRFLEFVDKIGSEGSPAFYFFHTLLPHVPSDYLPSGKFHSKSRRLDGMDSARRWSGRKKAIIQDQQRFLLQVGFADTMLGKLMKQLKRKGLFDSALIVVTADHGAGFEPRRFRRKLRRDNYHDILPIPMLIKAPRQKKGRIDRGTFQSIDLLPTISDLLDFEIPWEVEGVSVLDAELPKHRTVTAISTWNEGWQFQRYRPKRLDLKGVTVNRQLALFGTGFKKHFWSFGNFGGLVGLRPDQIGVEGESDVTVQLSLPSSVLELSSSTDFVPALLDGVPLGPDRQGGADLHLAVAINGVIRAVTPVQERLKKGRPARWVGMVAEESFHLGRNSVEIYVVREEEGNTKLRRAKVRFADS